MYNKGTCRGITIPDINLYYRVRVMKTSWYCIKTDRLSDGIIANPQILIHTSTKTWFVTKKLKLYNGKKKASSTYSTDITGCQCTEECKYILIYPEAQNTSPNFIRPQYNSTTLNRMEDKWEIAFNAWSQVNMIPVTQTLRKKQVNGTSWNWEASAKQRTQSITQKDKQQNGKISSPTPHHIEDWSPKFTKNSRNLTLKFQIPQLKNEVQN